MDKNEFGAGSSDPRNRQERGIVPALLRSEELAPKSCDGQNTTQMSTAGIWVDLATADEGAPPPEFYSQLRTAPPANVVEMLPGGPRALVPGEFLARREQYQRGVVRDTICCRDGGRCAVVECFDFRGWLSGLRPGVKPFFLREDRNGDLVRITHEREDRETYAKEREEYEAELAMNPGSEVDPPGTAKSLAR